jgi:hypothetical protein
MKETFELADFFIKLANGYIRSRQNGKWDWADALHFIPAGQALPRAVKGLENIVGEIRVAKESNPAALAELKAYLVSGIPGSQPYADLVLESFSSFCEGIQGIAVLFQKIKAA